MWKKNVLIRGNFFVWCIVFLKTPKILVFIKNAFTDHNFEDRALQIFKIGSLLVPSQFLVVYISNI